MSPVTVSIVQLGKSFAAVSDWTCLTPRNCCREWDRQIPDMQQVEIYLGQLGDKS